METRRTQAGLTRGMSCRAGGGQGRRMAEAASRRSTGPRGTHGQSGHSRAALTRLGRSTECGADTACGRAHLSPSEAGLSARRRRAAAARARTRYTVMTGRRGRARLINQTSPIRTRSTGPPPPYSIFGAGHIFIIITPHIHKRRHVAAVARAGGGRRRRPLDGGGRSPVKPPTFAYSSCTSYFLFVNINQNSLKLGR